MSAGTVLVVSGPTATGKTALGILLAQRLGGEIVSADSMQVYRRMDIGTAKASAAERNAVPHHMLDVVDPGEDYSVSRYVQDASLCCDDLLSRGVLPVIVGGTGLYIDALIAGVSFAAREDGDPALRRDLAARFDIEGGDSLLRELASFDPERASKLHVSDKRRIVRAIEIYRLTGETMTEHDRRTRALPPRYNAVRIVLDYVRRSDLYAAIDQRVDDMCAAGLFDEVRSLLGEGLSPACTAMQAIGYKEVARALEGELSEEEAVVLIKQNSRRYAKRQRTWFARAEDAFRLNWELRPDPAAGTAAVADYLAGHGLKGRECP